MFTTQSATYLARKIHDQIFAAPHPRRQTSTSAQADLLAVYPLSSIGSVTFNRQLTTGAAVDAAATDLLTRPVHAGRDRARVPSAVTQSPDYWSTPATTSPRSRRATGMPVRQGTETIYFNLYLPAGPMPANGWPVVIVGHGGNGHKNFNMTRIRRIPAAHGVAWLMHQRGGTRLRPAQHADARLDRWHQVELPAGGRGVDQNGDGQIGT